MVLLAHAVDLPDTLGGVLRVQTVALHHAGNAVLLVCVDKDRQNVAAVQNGGGAAPHKHAGTALCQLADDIPLDIVGDLTAGIKGVGQRGVIRKGVAAEEPAALPGGFVLIFDKGFTQTGLDGGFGDQNLVVTGDIQQLRQALADLAPAAAVLTTDTNDLGHFFCHTTFPPKVLTFVNIPIIIAIKAYLKC